jgi:CubicO group peptidase (beta-lactamase class C family)
MVDTGYNPDPSLKPRIAVTEYQAEPARGMVWGEVHDENGWSFGGVAGHGGVFSTAADMAVLAQTMINGGAYGRHRMRADSVQQMISNENGAFPGDEHGLGFELNQRWSLGGLSSLCTAGHTGYTGTSLVIDFSSRSFVILLTNRVHPRRSWGSVNPALVTAAQGLAEAIAVRPRSGRTPGSRARRARAPPS